MGWVCGYTAARAAPSVGEMTNPAVVAQGFPSWPWIAAFVILPVPTRLESTYACQDIIGILIDCGKGRR
jgi:hypothetical protein